MPVASDTESYRCGDQIFSLGCGVDLLPPEWSVWLGVPCSNIFEATSGMHSWLKFIATWGWNKCIPAPSHSSLSTSG